MTTLTLRVTHTVYDALEIVNTFIILSFTQFLMVLRYEYFSREV